MAVPLRENKCVYPSTRLAPLRKPITFIYQQFSSNQDHQSIASTPSAYSSCPRSNTFELELWHKWTFDTYQHFCDQKGGSENWQVLVPKLALKCDYLRYAVLAIAAAHIALELPAASSSNAPSPYMLAALRYHNAACQAFRDANGQAAVEDGSESTASRTTIFGFSLINIATTLGLSQGHAFSNVGGAEERTSIVQNIIMPSGLLQSIESIINSNLDEYKRGPFPIDLDFFARSPWQGFDEGTELALTRLRDIVDRARVHRKNQAINDANTEAITWPKKCFGFYIDDHKSTALIWPIRLSKKFTEAFENGEDVARLIVLHWAVLLDRFGKEKCFTRNLGGDAGGRAGQGSTRDGCMVGGQRAVGAGAGRSAMIKSHPQVGVTWLSSAISRT